MSRKGTITHRRNKKNKLNDFENSKASFVAGIAVIITVFNDTLGLLVSIPWWVEFIEVIICLLMFYFSLATKKLDCILNTTGVEKFGAYLTVYSIIVFMLEKMLITGVSNIEFEMALTNEKFIVFIFFLVFGIVGIGGAIYLLLSKYPKKK